MTNPMQSRIDASEMGRRDAQTMKVGDYYMSAHLRMKQYNFPTEEEATFYFGGFVSNAPNVEVDSFGIIADIRQR